MTETGNICDKFAVIGCQIGLNPGLDQLLSGIGEFISCSDKLGALVISQLLNGSSNFSKHLKVFLKASVVMLSNCSMWTARELIEVKITAYLFSSVLPSLIGMGRNNPSHSMSRVGLTPLYLLKDLLPFGFP